MANLFICAGPNGAGKSTFGEKLVKVFSAKVDYFNRDLEVARLRTENPNILDCVFNGIRIIKSQYTPLGIKQNFELLCGCRLECVIGT